MLNAQLIERIKTQTSDFDFSRRVEGWAIFNIKQATQQYKIALFAEFGSFDSYFVTRKAGFDTDSLLNSGERLFPPELASKVPEALFDIREAGRCLAYELPTAAGFHIFRATESVVRSYYRQTTGGKAPPKFAALVSI